MQTKLFVSAAAIALIAGLGSASAGEKFGTLENVPASTMSPSAMGAVTGRLGLSVQPARANPAAPSETACIPMPDAATFGLDGVARIMSGFVANTT